MHVVLTPRDPTTALVTKDTKETVSIALVRINFLFTYWPIIPFPHRRFPSENVIELIENRD